MVAGGERAREGCRRKIGGGEGRAGRVLGNIVQSGAHMDEDCVRAGLINARPRHRLHTHIHAHTTKIKKAAPFWAAPVQQTMGWHGRVASPSSPPSVGRSRFWKSAGPRVSAGVVGGVGHPGRPLPPPPSAQAAHCPPLPPMPSPVRGRGQGSHYARLGKTCLGVFRRCPAGSSALGLHWPAEPTSAPRGWGHPPRIPPSICGTPLVCCNVWGRCPGVLGVGLGVWGGRRGP